MPKEVAEKWIPKTENLDFGTDVDTNFFDEKLTNYLPKEVAEKWIPKTENLDFGTDADTNFFDEKLASNHTAIIQPIENQSFISPNFEFAKDEVHRLRRAISEAHAQQKVIVIDDISAQELDSLSDDLSFFDNIQDKEIFMETTNSQERWQLLIEKFINEEPSLGANRQHAVPAENKHDLAQVSTENRFFVSENLAMIYEKQGKIQRAIEIYEKLILKYPEKSSYFADRIEKLKS